MSLLTILIIILLIAVLGGLPRWGYHNYGWGPSGILGVVLVIILIVFLLERL
jgi:hypothetical protein